MIKMIVVDIDGTLALKKSKVSKENIAAIQKAKDQGISVVIATGRNITKIRKVAEQINSHNDKSPIISLNGGMIHYWDENNDLNITYKKGFEKSQSDIVFEAAKQNKILLFSYCEDDRYAYVNKKRGLFVWVLRRISKRKALLFDKTDKPMTIMKFICYGKSENMKSFRQEMEKHKFETFSWSYIAKGTTNLEVNPPGVDKSTALKMVADKMKIKPEEIIYFGDGENDLRALQWSGTGVAMGNAPDAIKESANEVTLHHKKHGVAVKINEILK
ncbi:HAD superfamily hydrolase [Spiroplasma sabaudiense Ar-1343]|uniref:HAD superfamily hydrolase n=1 Tax=Spiroplasma sabaudiense Ar-1343 TaxID=1276257 RepID=W6A9A0_9MOLU|nr:Cof-type HAD-IIB family hydrolase [Spiroplasma sabaudiense]AHI53602.1 HAD superfamily hydrolase [Spiroplasma sabaudiense Ar-1343]